MKKALPILLLLAAAAVGVWFLVGKGTGAPRVATESEDKPKDERPAPSLITNPGGREKPPTPRVPEVDEPADGGMDDQPTGPAIHGVVLDDETGKPVPGALALIERATPPCPRLPVDFRRFTAPATPAPAGSFLPVPLQAGTGEDGSFAIPSAAKADLFVRMVGYLMECVCEVTPDVAVTVRLKHGLSIEGIVIRENGQPIAGAIVKAKPAPGTPMLPGHLEATASDKDGHFTLTGLAPGLVVVSADHEKFVPTVLAPMEPGQRNVKIVLVPAFIVTFKIATYDGQDPDAPSLSWLTTGSPPRSGLQLLAYYAETDENGQVAKKYVPVKIPCDRPDVTLTVKSIGYAPWVSDPESLPPEGGEKTYDVRLERDMTLGALRITLEDKDGKPLSAAQEKAEAHPWRHDGKDAPGGNVVKTADVLLLPALSAGTYGVLVRSPLHAPYILKSVDVIAGRDIEAKAIMGPPAKVRVKFVAPEAGITVRFRLMQGRNSAYPYPETEPGKVATAQDPEKGDTDPAVLHAGADGLLLTGLAPGRYTIEVMSPELVALPTSVDIVDDEIHEIEVSVTKR